MSEKRRKVQHGESTDVNNKSKKIILDVPTIGTLQSMDGMLSSMFSGKYVGNAAVMIQHFFLGDAYSHCQF